MGNTAARLERIGRRDVQIICWNVCWFQMWVCTMKLCCLSVINVKTTLQAFTFIFFKHRYRRTDAADFSMFSLALMLPVSDVWCANRLNSTVGRVMVTLLRCLYMCKQVMIRRGQDYITNHLPSIHRDMAGMSSPDARVQYIRDLSEPPTAHNMHFYRLRRRKYDPAPGNDWLAICPKGLEVYEVLLLCIVCWIDCRMAINW